MNYRFMRTICVCAHAGRYAANSCEQGRARAAIGKLVREAQFVRHKNFDKHNRRHLGGGGGGHRRVRAKKISAPVSSSYLCCNAAYITLCG